MCSSAAVRSSSRIIACCCLIAGLAAIAKAQQPDAKAIAYFEQNIRPILSEHCYKCHSQEAKKLRGNLLLDSKAGWTKGGDNGPAIVAGAPDKSLLIKAVRYEDTIQMPPNGKLPDKAIELLTEWVKMGAPDPRLGTATVATPKTIDIEQARKYWAFQPLAKPTPPRTKNSSWCQTPVDYFILAKLEEKGLWPNPPIDRRKLIRRVAFDLTGLPPTPAEINAFVNDKSDRAYERLVDYYLDRPHFGERWGRHWLDIARFAESHGYEQDYDRPTAYHYRDFVIQALNQDLPFDKFVKWQIAGDEYEPNNRLALMATGFLAAGTHATQITANQAEKERYDELDDMARTIGTTMLGLTVGCARCHDHKFDPIPNSDYYRLVSTFSTTVRSDFDFDLDPAGYKQAKAAYDFDHAKIREPLDAYERTEQPTKFLLWELGRGLQYMGLASLQPQTSTKLQKQDQTAALKWFRTIDPAWRKLNAPVEQHAKKMPKPNLVKMLISSEGVPAVRLHTQGLDFYDPVYHVKRGDPNQKGEVASQGFLQVLMRTADQEKHWQTKPPAGVKTSYRRHALAEWLTDVDAGAGHLLARVIVNRLWQHHMGRGIVATPSDFGNQGEKPTHPELLDYLAGELVKNGWRMKPIHRLIMTSAVYLQNDDADEQRAQIDRENTLYWHRSPQRLEAEVIRDSMLAASGTLDPIMFGPGTLDPNHKRRSIYFFVKRSKLVPMMQLFDAPDSLQDLANRATTTIAPQALMMMNSPIIRSYAENFARRLRPDADLSLAKAVQVAYETALGRRPSNEEAEESVQFLREQQASYRVERKQDPLHLALGDLCQTLLSLNEFIYIE